MKSNNLSNSVELLKNIARTAAACSGLPALLLCALFFAPLSLANAAYAGVREDEAAAEIAAIIKRDITPEAVRVEIPDGGRSARIDCRGAKLSGIRVERLALDAALSGLPEKGAADYGSSLAQCVTSSKGEIVLLEDDVNAFFKDNSQLKGFKELHFDFAPKGYTATGKYEMDMAFIKLDVSLKAEGRLAVRRDGLYLDDTDIWVQGLKQPKSIADSVISKVNPLLLFSRIPFPVEFKEVSMTDREALLTGHPSAPNQPPRPGAAK